MFTGRGGRALLFDDFIGFLILILINAVSRTFSACLIPLASSSLGLFLCSGHNLHKPVKMTGTLVRISSVTGLSWQSESGQLGVAPGCGRALHVVSRAPRAVVPPPRQVWEGVTPRQGPITRRPIASEFSGGWAQCRAASRAVEWERDVCVRPDMT